MNPNNPNPNQQLRLNFGFNNDRNQYAEAGRQYPTTPSTFPQPVFQNQQGQQEVWGTQPTGNNYGAGYFMNTPYQQQYGQQSNVPTPGGAPFGVQARDHYNDGTNGLVHQFSHQNLGGGGTPRTGSPYGRQPSPGQQRPRTAGASGQPQHYNSFLAPPPMPSQSNGPSLTDDEPPPKNPDKYSDNVPKRARATTLIVSSFFKDAVQRAKDRNVRALDLNEYLENPQISDKRKEEKRKRMQRAEQEFLRFLRTKEKPDNFQTIKIIGKGAFGEVKLVQRKNDGKTYALKTLIKSEMYKKDQLAHVRAERDILAESDSAWVVKLFTTFQDNTFLYLLMEFLPGGDLMTMLIKYEIFTEDITRFYMAELTLAIEVVHKLGFIHRDIKPDNILLDRGGHIKLTDFGLSTGFKPQHDASYYQKLLSGRSNETSRYSIANNRNSINFDQINLTVSNRAQINTWRKSRRQLAYSTVGTPDYIAPEIFPVKGYDAKGYDQSCDWWSVGTIMFECLIGWPPFCAEDANDTYRKIIEWQRYLHFPHDQKLSHEAESFIKGLICNVENRLGREPFGASQIKSHAFFRGVDWDGLRKIRAPFEPKLQSNIDTQYFPIDEIPQTDTSAALRAQTAAQNPSGEESAEMSLPFIGYTYKRFDAFRGN